jgi:hypothetical protein
MTSKGILPFSIRTESSMECSFSDYRPQLEDSFESVSLYDDAVSHFIQALHRK